MTVFQYFITVQATAGLIVVAIGLMLGRKGS